MQLTDMAVPVWQEIANPWKSQTPLYYNCGGTDVRDLEQVISVSVPVA